jgi:hypothetical protein
MSYFDFTDDIIGIDQSNGITPTAMQPTLPPPTTTATAGVHQQPKDLSDWRNIQLGATPSPNFDPFWLPPTPVTPLSNPWTMPNNPMYPSPYNQVSPPSSSQYPYQWTNPNNHPPWKIPTFPIGPPPPFVNYNHPDADFTKNTVVNPSAPIRFDKYLFFNFFNIHFICRNFVPVQPTPYPYPIPPTPKVQSYPPRENELFLLPDIDFDEILGEVESVIPDIDLDAARRTITSLNRIPSTNDIVTYFLDNGYTKKSKKFYSNDPQRQSSLKRSISDIIEDIPKFLSSYPDPVNYFFDVKRKQSELYINHAKAFLLRAFPTTDKSILEQALEEENWHFLPTVRKLETRAGTRTNTFLQRMTIKRSLDMIGKMKF